MFLPDDYPDDFKHAGLREAWFDGVPWRIQSRAMAVNSKIRVIRNPVTEVFVCVMETNKGEREQVFPFFGVCNLVGWMPFAETRKGWPVETLYPMCEGMEASERAHKAKYGDTPASVTAGLVRERIRKQQADVARSREMSRFTRQYAVDFRKNPVHGLGMGMSPQKRFEKFRDATNDFLVARARHVELLDSSVESRIVVPA